MKAIWKWTLAPAAKQTIPMPQGAQILSVQMQGKKPQLWALVDPDRPVEGRTIIYYGTGFREVPDDPGHYLGTVQLADSALVLHIFEEV